MAEGLLCEQKCEEKKSAKSTEDSQSIECQTCKVNNLLIGTLQHSIWIPATFHYAICSIHQELSKPGKPSRNHNLNKKMSLIFPTTNYAGHLPVDIILSFETSHRPFVLHIPPVFTHTPIQTERIISHINMDIVRIIRLRQPKGFHLYHRTQKSKNKALHKNRRQIFFLMGKYFNFFLARSCQQILKKGSIMLKSQLGIQQSCIRCLWNFYVISMFFNISCFLYIITYQEIILAFSLLFVVRLGANIRFLFRNVFYSNANAYLDV